MWYFGSDPSLESLPVHETRLHTMILKQPEDFLALVRGHYLAVSTSLLYGSIKSTLRSNAAAADSYEQVTAILRSRRPVDRTMTFLIYDFTESKDAILRMDEGLPKTLTAERPAARLR